jgi:hypothetical protein
MIWQKKMHEKTEWVCGPMPLQLSPRSLGIQNELQFAINQTIAA